MPVAPSEIKRHNLARTTDGRVLGTSLSHIGTDDEEAKLQIARWSGEGIGYKKLAQTFAMIGAGLLELSGIGEFVLGNREEAKGDFLTALFFLGIGAAYTAYINRKIDTYEAGIRSLQSGDEIPTIKLPQPRSGGMEN